MPVPALTAQQHTTTTCRLAAGGCRSVTWQNHKRLSGGVWWSGVWHPAPGAACLCPTPCERAAPVQRWQQAALYCGLVEKRGQHTWFTAPSLSCLSLIMAAACEHRSSLEPQHRGLCTLCPVQCPVQGCSVGIKILSTGGLAPQTSQPTKKPPPLGHRAATTWPHVLKVLTQTFGAQKQRSRLLVPVLVKLPWPRSRWLTVWCGGCKRGLGALDCSPLSSTRSLVCVGQLVSSSCPRPAHT